MSLTFLPISQILPSLGEEAGWRGVMYPFLKEKLGPVAGRLIGGALWGVWHWPLVILGNYFYEDGYFGKPFLGPVMICITLCAFGILIDHYRRQHIRQLWPCRSKCCCFCPLRSNKSVLFTFRKCPRYKVLSLNF